MNGNILAVSSGTRLNPLIKDYLTIITKENQDNFKILFRDVLFYGLELEWTIQNEPEGIAEFYNFGTIKEISSRHTWINDSLHIDIFEKFKKIDYGEYSKSFFLEVNGYN